METYYRWVRPENVIQRKIHWKTLIEFSSFELSRSIFIKVARQRNGVHLDIITLSVAIMLGCNFDVVSREWKNRRPVWVTHANPYRILEWRFDGKKTPTTNTFPLWRVAFPNYWEILRLNPTSDRYCPQYRINIAFAVYSRARSATSVCVSANCSKNHIKQHIFIN